MRVRRHMAAAETTMNVSSIGYNLFHVMCSLMFQVIMADVVIASRPDKVVASP